MAQEFPSVNGEPQSWANIGIMFSAHEGGTLDADDMTDFSWKRTTETGEQIGKDGTIQGTTVGITKYESKGTFYVSGFWKMHAMLAEVAIAKGLVDETGAARVGLVNFDVLVQHTPLDKSSVTEAKITKCRLVEDGSSMSNNADTDKVEVNFKVGKKIYTKTPGGIWTVLT